MRTETTSIRTIARWALGGALVVAGTGHLTTQREEFQAQVPDWMPLDADLVVWALWSTGAWRWLRERRPSHAAR